MFQLQGRLGKVTRWPHASTTKALAFGIPGVYAYQVCTAGLLKQKLVIIIYNISYI